MEIKTLGDWCKWLEKNFSPDIMIPRLPVIIRLDGNNFSKWTKDLVKPFDQGLSKLMEETTKYLVEETNAIVGYTQSDEITLILYTDDRKSNLYHGGRKEKILSKLTGLCVTYFNERRAEFLPEHNRLANFDARIYQAPTLEDATAQLLWRENDATKNSISMLADTMFSEKQLRGLNGSQRQDKMMLEKGVNWNDLETRYKRGVYIKKMVKSIPFTTEEIDRLPAKHQARKDPNLRIERTVYDRVEYPIFNKIKNKVGVIFFNEEPILQEETEELWTEKN